MFLVIYTGPSSGLAFFVILLLIVLYIVLLIFAGQIATQRGRNSGTWIFLALLLSPFIAYLLLFLMGETEEAHRKRIIKEELWRKEINLK